MIWPSPEKATVTIFGGTLDLPVRPFRAADDALRPLPGPETAAPERPTMIRGGVQRIDRIGLEVATEGRSRYHVEDDDPLSAVAEMRRADTVVRDGWRIRIETRIKLSCTRDLFLLQAGLRASEDATEVCQREWQSSILRDFI